MSAVQVTEPLYDPWASVRGPQWPRLRAVPPRPRETHTRPRPPLMRHLPARPLVDLVQRRGGLSVCGIQQHSDLERAYYRAAEQGWVTAKAGDELAIQVLGLHPMLVWGDDWLV